MYNIKIRYATNNDTIRIIRAIQNKKMDYNTPTHIKNDIANNRLIIAVDEKTNKILGQVALEPKPAFDYIGVCRLCVYSKKSHGKGVASALLKYICSLGIDNLGATPWDNNPTTCHLFEKFGFKYQYTFLEHYKFYKKSA